MSSVDLAAPIAQRAPPLRHVAAVVVGNALEFYDFLAYSFFALQIGRAFFPAQNASSSLLLSLATFGAGFLTRPLGALVIGRMADRVGRRPAMILSFGLMGFGMLGLALNGNPYTPAAVAKFLGDADYFLISHALAHGHIIVTNETGHQLGQQPSIRKLKIPDVCNSVGVQCVSVFKMLRDGGAILVIYRTDE